MDCGGGFFDLEADFEVDILDRRRCEVVSEGVSEVKRKKGCE